jgi:hypothetical protein
MDLLSEIIVSKIKEKEIWVVDKPSNADFIYFTSLQQAIDWILDIIIDQFSNKSVITNIDIFDKYMNKIISALHGGYHIDFFLYNKQFCYHRSHLIEDSDMTCNLKHPMCICRITEIPRGCVSYLDNPLQQHPRIRVSLNEIDYRRSDNDYHKSYKIRRATLNA